ncbi:MAG: hypothetical protein IKT70_01785 [Clostridia bacterium]|nr:hypothetical protein [Clostridia bacterium]
MKKIIVLLTLICILAVTISCAEVDTHDPGNVTNDRDSDTTENNSDEGSVTDDNDLSRDTTVPDVGVTDVTDVTAASADDIPGASGGPDLCQLHGLYFHTFTGVLTDYVGVEKFNEWFENSYEKESGIEGCKYYANIYRFIDYFDVSREAFEELYYSTSMFYSSDYNIDILYGTDEAAVDRYYRSYAERKDEREKYSSLGEIKLGILEYAMNSNDKKTQEFFEAHCKNQILNINDWSIADFVRATGIKKSDLQALVADITVREYPGMTVVLNCFYLDYDTLYSITAENPVANNDTVSVIDKINEDLIFCGREKLSISIADENTSVK